MTITRAPDPNPRRIDRAAQPKRHEGPYYGEKLRRVLAPEPTDPLFIDRVADYYFDHKWPAMVLLVLGAAFMAASIVFIVGCDSIGGCQAGTTRCSHGAVEECRNLTGWDRQEVCVGVETCEFNNAAACGTYEIACCSSVTQ